MNESIKYVGLDVHKATIAVAVAEAGGGEVRYLGEIANTPRRSQSWCGSCGKAPGAVVVLRGGSVRLRHASAAEHCGRGLPGGGALADPEESGRPGQDRPPRRADAGAPAPGRRNDCGVGAGSGAGSAARSDAGTRGHEAPAAAGQAASVGVPAPPWSGFTARATGRRCIFAGWRR